MDRQPQQTVPRIRGTEYPVCPECRRPCTDCRYTNSLSDEDAARMRSYLYQPRAPRRRRARTTDAGVTQP